MTLETTAFDAAKCPGRDAAIAAFIADALTSDNAGDIAHALGVMAPAKGMSERAADTARRRQSLYKALSPTGNPPLSTVLSGMMLRRFKIHPLRPRLMPVAATVPRRIVGAAGQKGRGQSLRSTSLTGL